MTRNFILKPSLVVYHSDKIFYQNHQTGLEAKNSKKSHFKSNIKNIKICIIRFYNVQISYTICFFFLTVPIGKIVTSVNFCSDGNI